MSFTCPKCRRELANRRRPTCSYCGSSIPESLRMPHSAEVKLEEMRAAEIRAHGEFMGRDLSPGSVPYFPDSYVPDVGS